MSKEERKKRLHIIYFLGDGKTHALNFSFNFLKINLIVLAFFVMWAFVSLVWVSFQKYEIEYLSQRLTNTLSALLEFQIKEESLLEKIYTPHLQSSAPIQKPVFEKQQAEMEVQPLNLLKTKIGISGGDKNASIWVENPVLREDKKRIKLSFSLRNKTQSKKEGDISILFVWINKEGKGLDTFYPEEGSEKQNSISTFSIRQYKTSHFSFEKPKDYEILSRVEVQIKENSSTQYKFHVIALDS